MTDERVALRCVLMRAQYDRARSATTAAEAMCEQRLNAGNKGLANSATPGRRERGARPVPCRSDSAGA